MLIFEKLDQIEWIYFFTNVLGEQTFKDGWKNLNLSSEDEPVSYGFGVMRG